MNFHAHAYPAAAGALQHFSELVDLRTGSPPDFATLSVALQAVRRLAQD